MAGMNKNWRGVEKIVIGLYPRMVKGILSKYVINVYIMWTVRCFFFLHSSIISLRYRYMIYFLVIVNSFKYVMIILYEEV